MPRNRITLAEVPETPIGDLAALPPDQLALLVEEAAEALARARRLKEWLDGALDLRYRDRAARARIAEGKDAGTVRFTDGDFVVVADLPKRVRWDQKRLAEVVERIRAAGDDPAEYVSVQYRVSERAYGAWPSSIRAAFEPARTVETGKQVYRLKPIKGGA